MNEIVWVYGVSAAGKETFIKKMVNDKPFSVVEGLGWDTKNIIPCMESIEYVVQVAGDGNEQKRHLLPTIIKTLDESNTDSVILIKGQDLDLRADRITQTKILIPQATHRILFIDTPIDAVYERVQNKKWWTGIHPKEELLNWEKNQKNFLRTLQGDFEITIINHEYEIVGSVL